MTMMEGGDDGYVFPRTIEGSRQYDLRQQRIADNLRRSLKRGPGSYDWQMFQQEGCVADGVWRRWWCVYPCDDKDPLYEQGLWFGNERQARACLEWKRERARKRPGRIRRAAVRTWRALPWR